ncbi:hypothetical protein LPA44_03130 [Halobacterium sp. KA-4]|uniref:helix-turn-helix transcriptional regulator n=1 Tax=Halobacterium sp. KA-4 TaxID=2896367 RepID=UPI001E34EEE9|nr:hypothetical protein [Halobacterium sp. KA-4]MCD2198893.1 hypothetical protein [Halobacterium sp. KA-4]
MRQAALLVAVVCLLAVPVAGAVGAPAPQSAALQEDTEPAASGVDITVQIQSDGAARWNVSAKYPLEDANATAAFERLRERFEAGETDSEFSVDVFRAVAPSVSESVGREMEIRDASRSSHIVREGNNSTGVLTIEFTWTNFSRVEEERLVVDAFSTGWFGDLAANQTLTIRPPDGYDTDQVEPGPDSIANGAYRWNGPQTFGSDEPTVVFTEANSVVGVSMAALVVVGLFALVAGGASVWAYYRGEPALSWLRRVRDSIQSSESGGEAASGEPSVESEAGTEPTESVGGAAATTAGEAAESEPEDVDPELLSDEERVERLLHEHGGRMKQSEIVEETRWSTAKVSQLLSSMAEEGRVEKLRIGRENLISLPGEGVNDDLGEE